MSFFSPDTFSLAPCFESLFPCLFLFDSFHLEGVHMMIGEEGAIGMDNNEGFYVDFHRTVTRCFR